LRPEGADQQWSKKPPTELLNGFELMVGAARPKGDESE
jgi:hypothetical protein